MAINRAAPLAWLGNNLSSLTPAAPAVATSTVYVDTITYASSDIINPDLPFIGVWYDDNLTSYQRFTSNTNEATWVISIGVYLHRGLLQRYTKARAELQQIGEAWEEALITFIRSNRTLGGNVSGIGDSEADFLTLPLTPLPPWDEQECYGALLIIPLQETL